VGFLNPGLEPDLVRSVPSNERTEVRVDFASESPGDPVFLHETGTNSMPFILIVDLTADNANDVLAINHDGKIHMYENDPEVPLIQRGAPVGFREGVKLDGFVAADSDEDVTAGVLAVDLNLDGALDLIAWGDDLYWYEQVYDEDGHSTLIRETSPPHVTNEPHTLPGGGDGDGDGPPQVQALAPNTGNDDEGGPPPPTGSEGEEVPAPAPGPRFRYSGDSLCM